MLTTDTAAELRTYLTTLLNGILNELTNTDLVEYLERVNLQDLLVEVYRQERSDIVAENSMFRKLRSWHLVPSLYGNRWGNNGNSDRLYCLGLQNHCRW